MIEFPRIGSSKRGYPWQMAKGLKEDYARLVGVSLDEAEHIVNTVGAVIQDRLVRGQPCGIPFVCTLYVRHFEHHIRPGPGIINNPALNAVALKSAKKHGRWPEEWFKPRLIRSARLQMRVPKEIGELVRLSSPKTAEVEDQYAEAMKDSRNHLLQRRILRRTELYAASDVTGVRRPSRRERYGFKEYQKRYNRKYDLQLNALRRDTNHAIERFRKVEAGCSGGRSPCRRDPDPGRPNPAGADPGPPNGS